MDIQKHTLINVLLLVVPDDLQLAFYGVVKFLDRVTIVDVPNVKLVDKTIFLTWADKRLAFINHSEVAYKIGSYEGIGNIEKVIELWSDYS